MSQSSGERPLKNKDVEGKKKVRHTKYQNIRGMDMESRKGQQLKRKGDTDMDNSRCGKGNI